MKVLSLLAACVLAVLLCASPGCKLSSFATPEEAVQLEQGGAELDALSEADKAAIARVLDAMQGIQASLISGDAQLIEAALGVAQDALEASEASRAALDAALAEYGELEGAIRKRAAETAGTWILPGLPPPLNGPLGMLGIQGGLLLAFDRSRKHLKNMAAAAARGKLADAIKAASKALGLLHTEPADTLREKRNG